MEASGQLHALAAVYPGQESRHSPPPPRPVPGSHWIGGWVCLGAGLDPVERRKILHFRE
jgi:hypothetical protein